MKFLRLFAFVLLLCSLAVGAQVKNYSLADVWSLLEKRSPSGGYLYIFVPDRGLSTKSLVRVVYLTKERRVYIDITATTAVVNCQSVCEMKSDDPIIVEKFGTERSGKMFDSSLYMISNGPTFGDDAGDDFSPINQRLQKGKEISEVAKGVFAVYLQVIGEALERRAGQTARIEEVPVDIDIKTNPDKLRVRVFHDLKYEDAHFELLMPAGSSPFSVIEVLDKSEKGLPPYRLPLHYASTEARTRPGVQDFKIADMFIGAPQGRTTLELQLKAVPAGNERRTPTAEEHGSVVDFQLHILR